MDQPMPPTPDGVIAYLIVPDGAKAIDFYTRAFGAREFARKPAPDGRLMHARLHLNNGILMLSDDFVEYNGGKPSSPQPDQPTGVIMHMQVADCDATFNQAVAAGATPVMPPADMFWGDRYAQLRDPFGHRWSLGTALGAPG